MGTIGSSSTIYAERTTNGWHLWRRWTVATTVGELVGFAAPALAGVLMIRSASAPQQTALLTLIVLVLAGSFDGATRGVAQWLALRRALPALRWQQWTVATALAAVVDQSQATGQS